MEKAEEFDAAKYLDTAESAAAYLNAAIEDGDAAYFKVTLGTAARAKGMTEVARETGLSRDGLCKALCASGNPSYETVLKVLAALGLKVKIKPSPQWHRRHMSYIAANGQEITEEMIGRWYASYERGEFPAGERTVGEVVYGRPPLTSGGTAGNQGS